MIKGSTQEENITIVNTYVPNIGASLYIRQTWTDIKREIDSNIVIVKDFNLSTYNGQIIKTENKETKVSNDTPCKRNLIDIFRTFHPNSEEYNFFSSTHGTFSRTDYLFVHKSNLNNFKKIEIVSSIFSDHNAMRLDINCKEKTVRNTNIWRANNMFQNNQ